AAVHLAMLLVGRFIAGLAVGALSMLVPVYQSELASKEVRGRLISLQQFAITIGIAVSFWINFGTSKMQGSISWRLPLFLQLVPGIILGVGILFFPFSPRWLVSQNRDDEAIIVLARIRSDGDTNNPQVQEEYGEIKAEIETEKEVSVNSYAKLLQPPIRRRLVLGVLIQIFQQLTGINAVMYYAPKIFKQAGLSDNSVSLLATGITGVVNVCATIPAILWIDTWGRRPTMIYGAAVMALSMLTMGGLMGSHGRK
ncbi:unnamed protein product, partial [Didymodactylos carnosus]